MPRLTTNRTSKSLTTLLVAVMALMAAPGLAHASFAISNFDTFICTTPTSSAQCTEDNAPAGSHRAATVSFDFSGDEHVNDIIQHFPIGIIPNPEAVPYCEKLTFEAAVPTCPANSKLGTTTLNAHSDDLDIDLPAVTGDVYNLRVDPPYVGGLGFILLPGTAAATALAAPFTVRSGDSTIPELTDTLPSGEPDFNNPPLLPHDSDYGLTGISANVPTNVAGMVNITIKHIDYTLNGIVGGKPYISISTGCLSGRAQLEATSHEHPYPPPSAKVTNFSDIGTSTGCNATHPPFNPTLPTPSLSTTQSDTPSSYGLKLAVPDEETPEDAPAGDPPLGTLHDSNLRRVQLKLPEGTAISPSAANGLVACTDAQLGKGDNNPPQCPAASDIGDVTVKSVNVDHDLVGDMYVGQPTPQDTYRLFLAFPIVDGLWIKLNGVAKPDPVTGQISTDFVDLPALPFTDLTIETKRADGTPLLVNPAACGSHTIESVLTPWKFPPDFPVSSAQKPSTSFNVDGCMTPRPFNPVGTLSTDPAQAGADANLSMELTAPDRQQLLKTLRVALPPGLLGRLGGIPQCSVGDAASGTCADASRIGKLAVDVGAGPSPLGLPGSIYLADPLQAGDPASLSVVVPSKVGPYDFGDIVTRVRVILRPGDAGLDIALADDLPPIVGGVPIRVRKIAATVDHPNFISNPTNCGELKTTGTFTSREDAQAESSSPFQATGCDSLNFTPKLRLIEGGETKKFGHPSLQAILTQPAGQANIAKSLVLLPDLLRPETVLLNKPGVLCPPSTIDVRSCPASSIVGTASAVTPALPKPLSGPVYIIQAPGNPLPRLVVLLDGIVSFRLDAQNSIQGIRTLNDFYSIPDVPISRFELNIVGGSAKGILKNFTDACKATPASLTADATFTGQSGRTAKSNPKLELPVCAAANATPGVKVSLRKVKSGRPVLKLSARKASGGASLKGLSFKLPRGLKAFPSKARSGALVRTSAKLKRSAWKLTKSGKLTIKKLPKAGRSSISITLRRGVITPNRALAGKARSGKKPRLTFKVKVTNVTGKSFTLKRKVRAR